MGTIRTDLAVELVSGKAQEKGHKETETGIECHQEKRGALTLERVRIQTPQAEKETGKPRGEYLTVNTGRLWMDERGLFREKVFAFRDILSEMVKKAAPQNPSVLIAGLGNRQITADSVGPVAAEHLVITRHVRNSSPLLFEELGLFDLCALTPGVLGETGIESADVIGSVVRRIRPGIVIAIDALASRSLSRLVTTVQLTDTGIRPGAGVGNARPEITKESLGVPVIAIGVPTVVDAATLAHDAVAHLKISPEKEILREEFPGEDLNFFVTPKESDQIIRFMGAFLGYGINLSFNRHLSWEDMLSLIT